MNDIDEIDASKHGVCQDLVEPFAVVDWNTKCWKGSPTHSSLAALPVPVHNFLVLLCCSLKARLRGIPVANLDGILGSYTHMKGSN